MNGKFYGTVYVNDSEHAVRFSAQSGDEIFVLCENMGRVNVGWRMTDKKGDCRQVFNQRQCAFRVDWLPVADE